MQQVSKYIESSSEVGSQRVSLTFEVCGRASKLVQINQASIHSTYRKET